MEPRCVAQIRHEVRGIALQLPPVRIDDVKREAIAQRCPALQRAGGALVRPDALQAGKGLAHRVEVQAPPARSGRLARWTTTPSKNPSVSTRIWPAALASCRLLVSVEAPHAAHQGLDRLAVDNGSARGGIAAGMETRQLVQLAVDAGPGAIEPSLTEIPVDRLPGAILAR